MSKRGGIGGKKDLLELFAGPVSSFWGLDGVDLFCVVSGHGVAVIAVLVVLFYVFETLLVIGYILLVTKKSVVVYISRSYWL